VSSTRVSAGGGLRDRVESSATAAFVGLGIGLVVAGMTVPEARTLLFAWGGTALFLAALLRFVSVEPTVSAAVTTAIYTALATGARPADHSGRHRYVPEGDGSSLEVGEETFVPVGERLLATVETPHWAGTVEERLAVLVDVVVNELELARRVSARTTDHGATVTVTESRVGTDVVFDHPVGSIVGVALATHLGRPVDVDVRAEEEAAETLVVVCEWSQGADELLDSADADEAEEDQRPEQ
jgi:quercetin dioxygenase-like cupin family protein